MKTPAYTMTTQSITIVWKRKTYVVQKEAQNFKALRKVILDEDWDNIENCLTITQAIQHWSKGAFKTEDGVIKYQGKSLPIDFNQRITQMVGLGEDPTPLYRFWERLQQNPSFRSVEQLWPFLNNIGIPLTKEGCFLAYKGVNDNYTDKHSGRFDNSPGQVHEMPRNQVSDDPKTPCHAGLTN